MLIVTVAPSQTCSRQDSKLNTNIHSDYHVKKKGFPPPLFVSSTFLPDSNVWPRPLTPVKSMQRAASSDTLCTTAFSNADAKFYHSQHDAKQQLIHSQSMVLPENGKVFASRAHTVINCVYSREFKQTNRQYMGHLHMYKQRHLNTAHDVHLLPFRCLSSAEITPLTWPTSSWSLRLLRALQTAMAAHRWDHTASWV